MTPRERFDGMVGRLDRLLSEFLVEAKRVDLDEADRQTLKHHADDLVGVGNAALKAIADLPNRGAQSSIPIAELNLSVRAERVCEAAGLHQVGQLCLFTESDFARLPNSGKALARAVAVSLRQRGLAFCPEGGL